MTNLTVVTPKPHPIPCFNRVLIKLIPPDDKTIIIPDHVSNPEGKVLVLAIGPDVKAVSPGDHLLLIPNCNIIRVDHDQRTAIIHDSSIIAIEGKEETLGTN